MRPFDSFRRPPAVVASVLSALLLSTMAPAVEAQIASSIASNFNGTAIAAGNTIWFNSIIKYSGPETSPVTISIRNAKIEFTANSTPYVLSVPDADVTYSPSATMATTSFDTGTNRWVTVTPFGLSGNQFLSALGYQLPVNFPGGTNPVTWSGEFSSTGGPICIQWKWAAAVYTEFTSDNNAVGVKPADSNSATIYANSDHAGTPENYKPYVTGGARGGGGSNWTGSYSGTESVCDLPVPAEPRSWGALKAGYR